MRGIEQLATELMRGGVRKGHFEISITRVVMTRAAAKSLRDAFKVTKENAAEFDRLSGTSKLIGRTMWVATATVPQPKYGPMKISCAGFTYATAVRRLAKALRSGV
jgi:hypothetical protein